MAADLLFLHQQRCRAAALGSPVGAARPDIDQVEAYLDAEISTLLAIRQAGLQRLRAQQQRKLLQQVATAQHDSAPSLMHDTIMLAPADAATHLLADTALTSSFGMALADQSWASTGVISPQLAPTSMAAAQQAAAVLPTNSSRTSLDLASLQLSLALSAAGQQPFDAYESPNAGLLRPNAGNDLMLQSPFAGGAADRFSAVPQTQAGAGNSLGMSPELVAALSSLTAQGGSMVVLNPNPAPTPSPAMSRIGSAAVLNSMQGLQGDTSAPVLMPASAGFAPAAAAHTELLLFGGAAGGGGQLMGGGAVGAGGSSRHAPAHSASFSAVHAHADPVSQARLRRHSFHVDASSHAVGLNSGLQPGLRAAGGSSQVPQGMAYAAATPAAPRGVRRMSADMGNSTGSFLLGTEGLQYPMQYNGISSTRGEAVGLVHPTALSQARAAAACTPVASQPVSSCATQTALLDAACSRSSFEVRSRTAGAVGRHSLDVPQATAVADQGCVGQEPATHPAASQLAKKGTGVFMPRVGATPAWKDGKKGRAA